jgi:CheY-like chemotaxis protein
MFDVVILDLMLPDGAGSQLLPELRSKQIPVIIYSAYELPMQYKTMVDHVLIKSKTSNKKILSIVRHILSKKTVELS